MEEQLRQIKWILAGLLLCAVAGLARFGPLGLALAAAVWWAGFVAPFVLLFLALGFVALALWWLVRPVFRTLTHRLNALLRGEA